MAKLTVTEESGTWKIANEAGEYTTGSRTRINRIARDAVRIHGAVVIWKY